MDIVFVNLVYINIVYADLVIVDLICVDIVYVDLVCVNLQEALLHTSAHLDGFSLGNSPHLLAPSRILILDLTSLKCRIYLSIFRKQISNFSFQKCLE